MSDFSCYITIDNTQNKYPLTLGDSYASSGYWDPSPPLVIEPGTCINFRVHDPSGPHGSQGRCNYTTGVNQNCNIALNVSDPYNGSNLFFISVNGTGANSFQIATCGLTGKSVTGNNPGDWRGAEQGGVPSSGHPLSCLVKVTSL
jgi:hypothetical protein